MAVYIKPVFHNLIFISANQRQLTLNERLHPAIYTIENIVTIHITPEPRISAIYALLLIMSHRTIVLSTTRLTGTEIQICCLSSSGPPLSFNFNVI